MRIETVNSDDILLPADLQQVDAFFRRAAFVISHMDEEVGILLGVLRCLPAASSIIIVTNCQRHMLDQLRQGVAAHCFDRDIYLIHQKDPLIAALFRERGVFSLLGQDGLVVDGKGEGMYIGAMCAILLGHPRWIVFYDADNHAPAALLEYSFALARLFLEADAAQAMRGETPASHNVRICWSAKPVVEEGTLKYQALGRCTKVVTPILHQLVEYWHGPLSFAFVASNAGEQGMTISTIRNLKFSSGFSIESFIALALLEKAITTGGMEDLLLQQYMAMSAHFHDKGDNFHILKMIAQSLGCIYAFPAIVPASIEQRVEQECTRLGISPLPPRVYPPLQALGVREDVSFLQPYRLSANQANVFAAVVAD